MITIQNLTRNYGGGKGVFDLSLTVQSGEVFGFLGPNGAGKTTTIRHLMGFLQAEKGSCTVNGLDCWTKSPKIQAQLGYIAGEIALLDDMTGTEYLNFIANYRGLQHGGRKNELLERFELVPSGKIKKMSKGMKQKVGIVAAFMHNPAVLILDEPTSGLDPLMQNRFIELVQEERKQGKTILISSHIFEEVERTADRVGIIRSGILAVTDSVENLKSQQTKKYTLTFFNKEDADAFLNEKFETKKLSDSKLEVSVQNSLQQFINVLPKYNLKDLASHSQSLEEIFMQFYQLKTKN